VENELRAGTYESLVKDSLVEASKSLGERERGMLALRYERALQRTEIARVARVHPSTVTRQLQHTRETIRESVISTLSSKHGLSLLAIEECVADILSNPAYSLLG
jgi:DNA-directed RNA polymerase specialized sigma subunit